MRMEKSRILLEQDKCLVLQPELVKLVGRSAALLFQQIHYWISSNDTIGMIHEGQKWIYNSYDNWVKDLKTVSKSTINRSIRVLRNFDLVLVEKLSFHKSNRTNWYTINYKKLDDLLRSVKEDVSHRKLAKTLKNNDVILNLPSTQNDSFYITNKTNKKLRNHNISKKPEKNLSKYLNKPSISTLMLQIWNEIINPEIKAELTKTRCQLMVAAFKYKFDSCLNKWKNYCLQIASSNFLMGKTKNGFKIALDSALKFDFIRKIFEKHFGVNHKPSLPSTESSNLNLININNSNDSKEIKELKQKIFEKLGSVIYYHWFNDCTLKTSNDHKTLIILAQNKFYQDTIENNYRFKLEEILNKRVSVLIR